MCSTEAHCDCSQPQQLSSSHHCLCCCHRSEEAAKLKADATAHYKKREFPEALRLYAAGAEANPDPTDISFLLNQAAVHFETGDMAQCIKVCDGFD